MGQEVRLRVDALGAGLQYGLEVLVGFGEGAAASASLESRAVLFTSIFISLLVTLINTFLHRMLSASVDEERPPTLSRLELRGLLCRRCRRLRRRQRWRGQQLGEARP